MDASRSTHTPTAQTSSHFCFRRFSFFFSHSTCSHLSPLMFPWLLLSLILLLLLLIFSTTFHIAGLGVVCWLRYAKQIGFQSSGKLKREGKFGKTFRSFVSINLNPWTALEGRNNIHPWPCCRVAEGAESLNQQIFVNFVNLIEFSKILSSCNFRNKKNSSF